MRSAILATILGALAVSTYAMRVENEPTGNEPAAKKPKTYGRRKLSEWEMKRRSDRMWKYAQKRNRRREAAKKRATEEAAAIKANGGKKPFDYLKEGRACVLKACKMMKMTMKAAAMKGYHQIRTLRQGGFHCLKKKFKKAGELKKLPRGPKRREFLKKIKRKFKLKYMQKMRKLFDYVKAGTRCVAKNLKRSRMTLK